MKYLYQLCLILFISFLGELLAYLIPLPIPGGIYGLVLMLACLCLKIIRLEDVEKTADFLLKLMPILFIPAAVGVMVVSKELYHMLIPTVVIFFVSTVVVMGAAGKSSELVIRLQEKKHK